MSAIKWKSWTSLSRFAGPGGGKWPSRRGMRYLQGDNADNSVWGGGGGGGEGFGSAGVVIGEGGVPD